MSNSHNNDFMKSLDDNGLGDKGGKAPSFASSIFDGDKKDKESDNKDSKKDKPEDKPEEKSKQAKAKEERAKEETKVVQDNQEAALALLQLQVFDQAKSTIAQVIQSKRSEIQAVLATAITGLNVVEFRQPQQPQAPKDGPQIPELGKAPPEIHQVFAAKLAGEAVLVEQLAQVNAWRAFNGNDALSSPKNVAIPADDRLASAGRQLVEMRSLIDFSKPISNTPQMAWTKDIQSITGNKNESLTVAQAQIAQQLIDRKVQTLQTVLAKPELVAQVRAMKNDATLSAFLSRTEAKLFPQAIRIPAEVLNVNQVAVPKDAQAKSFEQIAQTRDFPGTDAISALGRQISQAKSYLEVGKTAEAKALLDPAKMDPAKIDPAVVRQFADWLKPLASASGRDLSVQLNDKFAVLKQVTNTVAGDGAPVELVSTKFLNLMQDSVASSRTHVPLPFESEAARRAVLYVCQNPNAIDHVLAGQPEEQKPVIVQEQITRMATAIAEQLPFIVGLHRGKNPPADYEQKVAAIVKDITFPPPVAEVVPVPPPPPPREAPPAPPEPMAPRTAAVDNTNSGALQRQEILPAVAELVSLDKTNIEPAAIDRGAMIRESAEAVLTERALVEPGAPPTVALVAPSSASLETPVFSMRAVSDMATRIAYISERFVSPANFTSASFNRSAADLSIQSTIMPIGIFSGLDNSEPARSVFANPVDTNSDALVAYSSFNIPSPFDVQPMQNQPVETHLTGSGSNLDGANRGVMAVGPNNIRSTYARRTNSSLSSQLMLSNASGNWTASSGGAVLAGASGGNSCNGGSCSASGASGSGGGGGGGFAFAFRPSWHHGFLNGMKGGGFAVNGMNPAGLRNKDDDKKDDDDDDDDSKISNRGWDSETQTA